MRPAGIQEISLQAPLEAAAGGASLRTHLPGEPDEDLEALAISVRHRTSDEAGGRQGSDRGNVQWQGRDLNPR
ncbi:MAG: hypothetical protein V3S52_07775, partial [Gemmatimonadota bacterium]